MNADGYGRGFCRRLDPDSMGDVTYGNATTRTFSIAVKSTKSFYKFKIGGVWQYKYATETLACPDTTGTYYWYFDTNNVLQVALDGTMGGTVFVLSSICGMAYYNKEEGLFIPAKDEQHGCIYDAEKHLNDHLTKNLLWFTGGEQTGFADASDSYTSVSASTHFDEDIPISIAALTNMPFAYLKTQSGVDGYVFTTADTKIAHIASGDTYASYNGDTGGGVMGLLECTSSTDYVINMMLATNLVAPYDKIKIIGTQTYSSRNKARAGLNNALSAIKLRGFPSAEAEWQFAWIAKRDGTLEDDGFANPVVNLRGRRLS